MHNVGLPPAAAAGRAEHSGATPADQRKVGRGATPGTCSRSLRPL